MIAIDHFDNPSATGGLQAWQRIIRTRSITVVLLGLALIACAVAGNAPN